MPEQIRAISLWQPWASLIAVGAKRFETRSWATSYRGPLVIHAAKKWGRAQAITMRLPEFAVLDGVALPLGYALCVVDLVDVIPTYARTFEMFSRQERAFGDFSPGRYAWKLEDVRPFAQPIPCAGKQGLWTWTGPLPGSEVRHA